MYFRIFWFVAYHVLADAEKRRNYDEYGTAGNSFGGTSSGPTRPKDHLNFSSEELFGKIFGEAKRGQDDQELEYGENLEASGTTKEHILNLTFEQAAKGAEVQIMISLKSVCPKCQGEKGEMGFTWQICVFCEGTGITSFS